MDVTLDGTLELERSKIEHDMVGRSFEMSVNLIPASGPALLFPATTGMVNLLDLPHFLLMLVMLMLDDGERDDKRNDLRCLLNRFEHFLQHNLLDYFMLVAVDKSQNKRTHRHQKQCNSHPACCVYY